jgi:uroporphyrinogen-III synthase
MAETLILTRPRRQSEAFAAAVAEAMPGRFAVLVSPLIEIAPVAGALDLGGLQGIVFTSANGVEQFTARSPERGLVAWCVGDMTAAAAEAAGFEARSADGDVNALAALVVAANRPGAGAFLHVRGRHAAGDLVGNLTAAGVAARAAEIYDQTPLRLAGPARGLLAQGGPAVLALFSPRSARLFAAEARDAGWPLGRVTAVSIAAAADAGLAGLGLGRRVLAETPGRAGMLAALASL